MYFFTFYRKEKECFNTQNIPLVVTLILPQILDSLPPMMDSEGQPRLCVDRRRLYFGVGFTSSVSSLPADVKI